MISHLILTLLLLYPKPEYVYIIPKPVKFSNNPVFCTLNATDCSLVGLFELLRHYFIIILSLSYDLCCFRLLAHAKYDIFYSPFVPL